MALAWDLLGTQRAVREDTQGMTQAENRPKAALPATRATILSTCVGTTQHRAPIMWCVAAGEQRLVSVQKHASKLCKEGGHEPMHELFALVFVRPAVTNTTVKAYGRVYVSESQDPLV